MPPGMVTIETIQVHIDNNQITWKRNHNTDIKLEVR